MFTINGKHTTAAVMIDNIEETCMAQINHFVNHLAFTNQVIIMPDCLSSDTEILTLTGFKKFSDLLYEDKIACIDFTSKQAVFEKPSKIIIRELRKGEKVYKYTSSRYKFEKIVTEKHRMALMDNPDIHAEDTPEVLHVKDFCWHANGLKNPSKFSNMTIEEILLSVWIVGDGNIKITHNEKSDNKRIRFGLKKQRKIDRILELCSILNLDITVCPSPKQTEIYLSTKDSKKFLEFLPNKNMPFSLLAYLNKEEAQKVITEFVKVDGDWLNYKKTGRIRLNSSHKESLDFVSALVSLNYSTSVINSRENKTKYGFVKMYYLDITQAHNLKKSQNGLHNLKIIKTVSNYKDKVVCVTCPTGFFIARRKNRTFITGNCHAGQGSVIGFTMEMSDKIIPNVVGVDVSCGMLSVNIGTDLKCSLEELDRKIRESVPFGQEIHEKAILDMKKDFPWHRANVLAEKFAMAYWNKFNVNLDLPNYDIDWFLEKCKLIGGNLSRYTGSIGTLGGGNHFIETGLSNDNYWITIHSGSRNFGKRVCDYWQHKAVKILRDDKKKELRDKVEKIREQYKYTPRKIKEEVAKAREELGLNYGIDMKGLEWLEGEAAAGYLFDMIFCQIYAELNREYIIRIIENILGVTRQDKIETVHNFIDFKDFIIRKGAIRSYEKERMIIPFNMRDGILICEGKSNPDWNYSAPHGAGRVMSRSKARKKLDVNEFKAQMNKIYSTSVDEGTLDEAPGAYKDSSLIEEAIEPTAIIIDRIKPIHNMKDNCEYRMRGNAVVRVKNWNRR